MAPDVQIVELADLPGRLAVARLLASWHVAEWGHLYADWTAEVAEAELAAMDRPGRIPTTWVAFAGASREGPDVLGSVSLISDDELAGYEHLAPWLASLYVVPAARGWGLGRRLVDVVVRRARDLGVRRLHLYTVGQEAFYAALGWRTVGRPIVGGHEAAIMCWDTGPRTPRRALASHWLADPDVATAYSYLRPGGTPADRDLLATPLGLGLHLAGEAASSDHPGTMHGAWFSGERAAADVRAELPAGGEVVVVGAGLAGLAAARVLGATGRYRVVVLEAAAIPGGRTRADESLGGPLHLGAAWIHGEVGNPVAEHAAALGIGLISSQFEQIATCVVGHGRLTTAEQARLERIRQEVEEDLTRAEAEPSDVAVGPALRAALDRHAGNGEDRTVLAGWLRGTYENLYAAPLDDLSLRYRAEPFHLPGEDRMLAGSLNRVVAALAADLDVRCGHRVTAVERDAGRWRVAVAEGDAVRADAVVVTAPVGALRAGRIRFEPPLPPAVADPPLPVELWVDVSVLAGRPTLCGFATGAHAVAVEQFDEDGLRDLATA